jgi:hypothetical protein
MECHSAQREESVGSAWQQEHYLTAAAPAAAPVAALGMTFSSTNKTTYASGLKYFRVL